MFHLQDSTATQKPQIQNTGFRQRGASLSSDVPATLTRGDLKTLRILFKASVQGALAYASEVSGVSSRVLSGCVWGTSVPQGEDAALIKAWLAIVRPDELRGVPNLLMKELRQALSDATVDFRRATANAIGVSESDLLRWLSGVAKPSITNVHLIKAWANRGGFNTPAHIHAASASNSDHNEVMALLRAIFRRAPVGAVKVAAEEIGISPNTLSAYILGARRASDEALQGIREWLKRTDVDSFQPLTDLQWTIFQQRVSGMADADLALCAIELNASASTIKTWAATPYLYVAPSLTSVRSIKAWLRGGGKAAAGKSK